MSQFKDKLVSFAPLSKAIPGTLVMESMLLSETRGGRESLTAKGKTIPETELPRSQSECQPRMEILCAPTAPYVSLLKPP